MKALKPQPVGTLAIIQARMNSTRLPGKVLMEIEGHAMLWHVVNRARQSKLIDEVVIATSTSKSDDAVENFCKKENIAYYRGEENDVLDRFYHAAAVYSPFTVVRLTADCPLLDAQVIDRIIVEYRKAGVDYASNTGRYTYPEGLDAEVFSFASLETAWKEAKKPSEREHVTPYLKLSGKFKTTNVESTQDLSSRNFHWSVDHESDLTFAREIFRAFKDRTHFRFEEILALIEKKPELGLINTNQVVNAGYYKTLYQQAKSEAAPKRNVSQSQILLERAKASIPGAAQTFSKSSMQFVQGVSPLFLQRGKGCNVWDVDGNEYVDYVQGLLANILGYANDEVNAAVTKQLQDGHSFSLPHPLETLLAERLKTIIPCAEAVRFGKNGSDATSGAVRAARAFTGRDRIATCGYHGWQDWYIGSTTRNAGVPKAVQELTHAFPYNDLAKLEMLLEAHPGEFAAVIMEPFNFTELYPGYLQGVKDLTTKHGTLLIFDEICTGFVFGLGGAQKLYNVKPDLACFGKAMGNGFPISCVVGRKEVMNIFEEIFFSFTFGGEVASLAASMQVLEILENSDALKRMESHGRVLQQGFNSLAKEAGLENRFECVGRPQWSLLKFKDANGKDSFLERSLFQQEATKRGILLLVTHNMCAAHDTLSTEKTLEAYAGVFKTLSSWLQDPNPARFLEGAPIQPVFRVRN